MKVYSWNMLFRNEELGRAAAFIKESSFDIFCLQEVPEPFLKELEAFGYPLAYRTDAERITDGKVTRHYNVILSKHPIMGEGDIPFPDYWPRTPLRSRAFIWFMRLFHFSKVSDRGGIFADIDVRGTRIRVFNLHLILAHPEWRLKEFELAMAERDRSRPTIVCGDFNILEAFPITLLNWLMGGKPGDAAFYTRERTTIEERFVEHELTNPLRGTVTHPLSRSQLDHILLSHHLKAGDAEVMSERYGSDHNPIRVSLRVVSHIA